LAASLISSSWIVFLPACFDISAALEDIFAAIPIRTSVKASTPSADTLLAPAFTRILATAAFGIVEIFLPINPPSLYLQKKFGENKNNPLVFVMGLH